MTERDKPTPDEIERFGQPLSVVAKAHGVKHDGHTYDQATLYSGTPDALEAFRQELRWRGCRCRWTTNTTLAVED
jgi:hypothetical protein